MNTMRDTIIVGGGIAGLSAAYFLGKKPEKPISITVFESENYWGGKIITLRKDGFVIEGGPDTFVATKPWGVSLCKELGLSERLKGTNPKNKKTYILKNNKLHELPGGLTMMIPTEFGPMIRTGLLSWTAKARMGLDFFLPPKKTNSDETMGEFVSRRLGRSAYENLIEPLMSGIYAGDGDLLSVKSTLPYLQNLESDYGGLVKGALATRRKRAKQSKKNGNIRSMTSGSRSIFLTPESGLAEIVEALINSLKSSEVDLRLNNRVEKILSTINGYQVVLDDGSLFSAKNIILATPAYVAGDLIESFAPELANELRSVEYISTATVTLAFRQSDLKRPLDGYGYVIPRKEGRKALACTWSSTKFPHRAPKESVLMRVFIGRAGQESEIAWEKDKLVEIARQELKQTLGISAKPLFEEVFHWDRAMPQYNVGHSERLSRIEESVNTHPGLALAGNGYQGIGIPDCIHSGEMAAERIFQFIPSDFFQT